MLRSNTKIREVYKTSKFCLSNQFWSQLNMLK